MTTTQQLGDDSLHVLQQLARQLRQQLRRQPAAVAGKAVELDELHDVARRHAAPQRQPLLVRVQGLRAEHHAAACAFAEAGIPKAMQSSLAPPKRRKEAPQPQTPSLTFIAPKSSLPIPTMRMDIGSDEASITALTVSCSTRRKAGPGNERGAAARRRVAQPGGGVRACAWWWREGSRGRMSLTLHACPRPYGAYSAALLP